VGGPRSEDNPGAKMQLYLKIAKAKKKRKKERKMCGGP
jgi:hypothetical protein